MLATQIRLTADPCYLIGLAGNPAVSCPRDRRLCVPALRRVCPCKQGFSRDASVASSNRP